MNHLADSSTSEGGGTPRLSVASHVDSIGACHKGKIIGLGSPCIPTQEERLGILALLQFSLEELLSIQWDIPSSAQLMGVPCR